MKHKWYEYIFPVLFLAFSSLNIIEGATPGNESSIQSNFLGRLLDFGPKDATLINADSITINGDDTIFVNESKSYSVTFNPNDASDKTVTYELLENESEATLTGSTITALKEGQIKLLCRSDAYNLTCEKEINLIKRPIENLEISLNDLNFITGQTSHLSIKTNITSFKNYNVSYIISDENVLKVDGRNYLHTLKSGECDLTLKVDDFLSNVLHIQVEDGDFIKPTSINFDDLEVYAQDQALIQPKFNDNCSDTNFYLSCDNKNVSISGKTIYSAIVGEYRCIIHSIYDSNLTKEFTFKVDEVKAKSITSNTLILQYGKTVQLTYTVNSEIENKTVTYPSVNFKSLNEDIVTVDSAGFLLGRSKGNGVIRITLNNNTEIYCDVFITVTSLTETTFSNITSVIRKLIGHFGLYFITGIFAFLTLYFFVPKNKIALIIASIVNILYGFILSGLSEYLQISAGNRTPAFSDVLIDFSGYISGNIFILLIFLLVLSILKKKKDNNAIRK